MASDEPMNLMPCGFCGSDTYSHKVCFGVRICEDCLRESVDYYYWEKRTILTKAYAMVRLCLSDFYGNHGYVKLSDAPTITADSQRRQYHGFVVRDDV